jgi:hypothetical protein
MGSQIKLFRFALTSESNYESLVQEKINEWIYVQRDIEVTNISFSSIGFTEILIAVIYKVV